MDRNQTTTRRQFLRSAAAIAISTIAGCGYRDREGSKTGSHETKITATTTDSNVGSNPITKTSEAFQPTTFTGTPHWQDVTTLNHGAGDIDVFIFFDYAQEESYKFWTRTWDAIEHYAVYDQIMANFRHLPKPVSKWSMFLPCVVFEIGHQLGWRKQEEFHFRLYDELYPDYTIRDIEVMAGAMGADVEEVIQAGKRRKRRPQLEMHKQVGSLFDVSEPFAITIDGDPIRTPDYEVIDREIRKRLDD